ncbi:MAG: hypothetical protein ACXVBD_14855 [Pseudobdellovibrio sp.]
MSALVENQTIKSILPGSVTNRTANLEDLAYVTRDQFFTEIVKNVGSKMEKDLIDKAQVDKIKNQIFPDVKKMIIQRLSELNLPPEQLASIKTKINAIKFEGAYCGPTKETEKNDFISNLLTNNADYNVATNSIRMCAGLLLQSTSAFGIVNILAHEISHSFDPCSLDYGPQDADFHYTNRNDLDKSQQEFPLSKVVQCLRSPSSVGARNFQLEDNIQALQEMERERQLAAQQMQIYQQQGGASPYSVSGTMGSGGYGVPLPAGGYGTYPAMGGTVSAEPPTKPVTFCDKDQITESFADWMSAETLPRYMKKNYNLTADQYKTGYSNAFRSICFVYADPDSARNTSKDEHPLTEDRINKIFLSNPQIRSQMGCGNTENKNAVYCSNQNSFNGGIGNPPIPTAADSGPATAPTTANPGGSGGPAALPMPPSTPPASGVNQ